eukprot:TRINITY_DN1351_c0_g1_i1.p1 TRINITY_DN1351_c0_g1~~TRINITY_DN1351_c0_g1_i1.p1  ORF type:complete len:272 (-),score=65.29 TRINITY_DN1351_c0_g1_i1:27-842(-)
MRSSWRSGPRGPECTPTIQYSKLSGLAKNISGVSFDKLGKHLICSAAKYFPTLYAIEEEIPKCVFENKNFKDYCTYKSAQFGGNDDQFVVSGSDDFRIYVWERPPIDGAPGKEEQNTNQNKYWGDDFDILYARKCKAILIGHRSIVNNIAFHPVEPLMVSSGVEKIIKFWSPFPFGPSDLIPTVKRGRSPTIFNSDEEEEEEDEEEAIEGLELSDGDEDGTKEDKMVLRLFDYLNYVEAYHPNMMEAVQSDEDNESSDSDDEARDYDVEDE